VDGTCWASTRGYGRFLRELLPELLRLDSDHRYTLILDAGPPTTTDLPAVRTIVVDTSPDRRSRRPRVGTQPVRSLAHGRATAGARLDVMSFRRVQLFPVPSRVPVAVAFSRHDRRSARRGVFPDRRTRWLWNAKVRSRCGKRELS